MAGELVFPDAQGFGIETPAGRGGAIIRVTNLNSEGPGSLRAALDAKGQEGGCLELPAGRWMSGTSSGTSLELPPGRWMS
ncbi:MAG: hypothetical protein ACLQVN_08115, partial [Bryobacteraceae bacterium]